ncbi:phage integrase central domain-containing protein [Burkholderia plantarii]|uniref:phage integrase central domain-containing protein n=1 Tax=Burkholderia plantarii TaxID=41899 RepID=UPI0035566EC6
MWRAWLEERRPYVEPWQHERTLVRLKSGVFPCKRPIADIDAPEILAVLKRIDSRGSRLPYTAFAAKLAESGRFVR